MATYLTLNIIFMAMILTILVATKTLIWNRSMTWLLGLLILLTAIFDSLIIAADIVDYDFSKTIGITIGYAPIEDFMYAILALLIIPSVWHRLGGKDDRKIK